MSDNRPAVHVTELRDESELAELYPQLLVSNFPASELDSLAHLSARWRAGALVVLVAQDAAGSALGMAIADVDGPIALLSYLAVSAASRGTGAGGALVAEITRRLVERPGTCAVLAEVARPDAHATDPLHGDPARRLTFYARQGARALNLPYFQPALGPGMDRERGMLLIVLGAEPSCVRGDRFVATAQLRAFIDEYLAESGDRPLEDDAEGRALAEAMREPVELLPLTDYARIPSS